MNKTMKAVRINQTGDISVLNYGDYDIPIINDNDILVKVMATAVSAWDIKYRNGDIFGQHGVQLPGRTHFPLPQQLGREATGIVEAVGKNVSHFAVGDRVMGLVHPQNNFCDNTLRGLGNLSTHIDYPGHVMFGGYAQYIARPEHYWMKMPDNVDFQTAAAGAWSYPTSHRLIVDRCNVSIGDTVLITGISGSIGNALLAWSKLRGATVIGTTTQESKINDLKQLGVDHVVVTDNIEKAHQDLQALSNGGGFNHAIELTGAQPLRTLCLNNLACGSTYCPLAEAPNNDNITFNLKKDLIGLELTVLSIRGSTLRDQYTYLKALSQNQLQVPIATQLPLSEVQKAHQLVEEHKAVGKVILLPWA